MSRKDVPIQSGSSNPEVSKYIYNYEFFIIFLNCRIFIKFNIDPMKRTDESSLQITISPVYKYNFTIIKNEN